ncbi:DNA (Cytosine-5)-methyltransferase DRM1/2 isoform 4 [Hibiscus syriacus]|uniref:DNA (Cytosine-5)-methyltransferase DRM1/2 isoform 4 n=1 Tax=Hibiscus syriacus TaxID=106335 RepID=A0A6A2XLZ5_HIBSY|nr:DNA (Cytosine-5)-methyltransferase DRM1/2 isoform 4 [Hibiscus syriacus]
MKRSFRMISQILIVLSDTEEILNYDSDEENKLLYLTKMGYSKAEASIAMEICDPNSSIAELTDFICAAQMAKAANTLLSGEDKKPLCNDPNYKKRQNSDQITQRTLPEDAIGSPYLYYEQIHLLNPMIGLRKGSVRLLKLMMMSHLRVSRSMFLMSAENGICDAEVAFYCLGISLKTDVQELNNDRLEQLMSRFVELDLVVGGIQRNNLTCNGC